MHIGSDYTFMLENYNSCCHLVMILGKALGGGLLAVKSSSCRSRCYTLHSAWRAWEVSDFYAFLIKLFLHYQTQMQNLMKETN